MEYIQNAITFREAIGKEIDVKEKVNAIQNVYEAVKFIHSHHIFLGDIHADNFLMTTDDSGYLIDLDYMHFPGDEYKFQQSYLVKPNNQTNKINVASAYTDNVKVMVSCLSLLLDRDLEKLISHQDHSLNLEELYQKIILPLNNPELNDYVCRLQRQENVEYFCDCSFFQNLLTNSKRVRINA